MEQFIMNTRIYMGAGSLEKIRDLEIERAYIICDPFMKQSGKADQIAALLSERGACWEIFSEVVPDPTIGVVTKGIEGMCAFRPAVPPSTRPKQSATCTRPWTKSSGPAWWRCRLPAEPAAR